MRAIRWCLPLLLASVAGAQSTLATAPGPFVPGGRTIFATDFSTDPVGSFPSSLRLVNGPIAVGTFNGTPMLKVSGTGEFQIPLPERLPQSFTIEIGIVTRPGCCEHFRIEGTPTSTGGAAGSAELRWGHQGTGIYGGGGNGRQARMPEELISELPSRLGRVQLQVDGTSFRLYTNDEMVFNYPDIVFRRGDILRVWVGANNDNTGAIYFASIRIATGPPAGGAAVQPGGNTGGANTAGANTAGTTKPSTVTGVLATVTAQGSPSLKWDPVPGATGYFVVRWKTDEASCCTNMSPPGQLISGTTWLDAALPKNGPYAWRVIATTPAGPVDGSASLSFQSGTPAASTPAVIAAANPPLANRTPQVGGTAPPAATTTTTTTTTTPVPVVVQPVQQQTGTITPLPAGSGATTGSTGSTSGGGAANTSAPASTSSGGPGAAASGTYRVTLTGIRVTRETKDDIVHLDGRYNEVYAAAVAVAWSRSANQILTRGVAKTAVYGDVTPTASRFPGRIQAGTASPQGGIWSGNGTDVVPGGYDPGGSGIPAATADRFPLRVWEGTLTDGLEALLIVPSIWDRDASDISFIGYRQRWETSPLTALIGSPVVQGLLPGANVGSAISNVHPGLPMVMTNQDMLAGVLDRPIGVVPGLVAAPYQDRYLVVTREKLASLSPGSGTTVSVAYNEPMDILTGGQYTLYIRIDRVQ